MTVSHASPAARWIVVTPTPASADWHAAILTAAEAAGLRAVVVDAATADHAETPADILVTDNAELAAAAGAERITAILPDPEATAMSWPEASDGDYIGRLRQASKRLAAACSLEARHPVIGADALADLSGPLTLFSDLAIEPPRPVSLDLDNDRAKAFAAILRLYRGGRPVSGMPASDWSPLVFECDARSLNGAAGEFDLTGRPRFLIFGPYISLPIGRWSARLRVSIDEEACHRQFRLDWGTPSTWAEQLFIPGRPGVFEMELEHEWSEAAEAEARFLIMEGCFSGAVSFLGAAITRIDNVPRVVMAPVEAPTEASES